MRYLSLNQANRRFPLWRPFTSIRGGQISQQIRWLGQKWTNASDSIMVHSSPASGSQLPRPSQKSRLLRQSFLIQWIWHFLRMSPTWWSGSKRFIVGSNESGDRTKTQLNNIQRSCSEAYVCHDASYLLLATYGTWRLYLLGEVPLLSITSATPNATSVLKTFHRWNCLHFLSLTFWDPYQNEPSNKVVVVVTERCSGLTRAIPIKKTAATTWHVSSLNIWLYRMPSPTKIWCTTDHSLLETFSMMFVRVSSPKCWRKLPPTCRRTDEPSGTIKPFSIDSVITSASTRTIEIRSPAANVCPQRPKRTGR